MPNITLHPRLLTAMPAYEHAIGVGTILLSSLAFYLMLTKTPTRARPFTRYLMLLQVSITLVDINFGFLFCPVSLHPAPGGLCFGLICAWFGFSGHAGNTIYVFTLILTVISIIYCFHYKYVTIRQMTNGNTKSNKNRFRISIGMIYCIPALLDLGNYRYSADGSEFIKINYPSLAYLFESHDFSVHSYDPTLFRTYRKVLVLSGLSAILLAATIVFYFVVTTFNRLSTQSSISEKTRALQQKTMTWLIIQTVPPLAMQISPLLIYLASSVISSFNPNIYNALLCFQLTHALFHTSILILSSPSYRSACKIWQSKKTSVSSMYSQR